MSSRPTTTGYQFKTSQEQDKATMAAFSKQMETGKKGKTDARGFTEHVLKDEYHGVENNCTTMCLLGVGAGSPELKAALGDPKESKGRGLSGLEKFGAGKAIGGHIFMPQDLQQNIENAHGYSKRQEYKSGNPLPE